MKKIILFIIFSLIINNGCTSLPTKKQTLANGISKEQIFKDWGKPKNKILVGITPKTNYPVEIWEYAEKKGSPWSRKEEFTLLIFVDEELYAWTINDPKKTYEILMELGVLKEELLDQQKIQSLQSAAEQAQRIQQLMEIINTYKTYNNTQMQIYNMQTQQQIRIYQQRQSLPPPPPKPQPAKQQK